MAQFLHSSGSMYLNHYVMELHQSVDLQRLQNAWRVAQDRFDMLRTGFAEVDAGHIPFAMITYKKGEMSLPWGDQRDCHSVDVERGQETARTEILARLQDPPWRLAVTRRDSKVYLQLSALHSLYDAQSLRTIFHGVHEAYEGRNIAPEVPIESTLGRILQANSASPEGQQDFWQDRMKDVHLSRFPVLTPSRVASNAVVTVKQTCSLSRGQLERRCQERGVTLQAAGQAAWARILSAYTGEASVSYGLVLSGRLAEYDASQTVAFPCVSTLPICCRLTGKNEDLMRQIMEDTKQLLKNPSTPLSTIQRILGRPREPLFDSIFAYQKMEGPESGRRPPWDIVEEIASADVSLRWTAKGLYDLLTVHRPLSLLSWSPATMSFISQ